MAISIPVKLLNEAQGHVITVELTSGVSYKGKLIESEDTMNVQLKDATMTNTNGSTQYQPQVFIRGSQIRFFAVPEILKHAPMFDPNHVKPPAPIRGPKRK
ncbi:hypothetical protein HPODL_05271 [Ogataea parapolymorpha DL-1]|uniref:Small nuclear ribonucleoprotein Sm D3 n=1 Tax=Ogataea parapolymorpha (strain ATCC 26012 / BCRC 20466 / JCM 22074 / NRRL Y-7560 / DL-1) TaxID=871575 RepID=W1QE82_OGAPD|nr:hypothetical protein HPODL_05271 [Ogataea parapolymorpha DL-1]ESW98854.1 hypothetical protein HPODL_05271 [Ogataea parapolymorpha DL-1]